MYADIRRPAVVRCVLHAVRCILYAACCVLHVVCCCTSSVTCGILYGLRSVTAADGRGGAVELPLAGLESPVRAVPLSLTHAHNRHARTLVPRGSHVFASFGKAVKFTRVGSVQSFRPRWVIRRWRGVSVAFGIAAVCLFASAAHRTFARGTYAVGPRTAQVGVTVAGCVALRCVALRVS